MASAWQALEGLIGLAFTDPTSGLHNRRALDEVTKLPIGFDLSLGALMIDLTGFKRVNDEGGHAAGDAALRRVGQTLSEMCSRDGPFADVLPFRYGGDEFCVLLPATTFESFVEVEHLARLQWRDFTLQDKPLGFGASIGIAAPDAEVGIVELIARADVAATMSKHSGDEPVLWTPSIEANETMASPRKRCGSCAATITVHVARARIVEGGFKNCPNCGAVLS